MKSSVPRPSSRRILARSKAFRRSWTPEKIADSCSNSRGLVRQQPGDRGLAAARRTPQDHARHAARLQHARASPRRRDDPARRPPDNVAGRKRSASGAVRSSPSRRLQRLAMRRPYNGRGRHGQCEGKTTCEGRDAVSAAPPSLARSERDDAEQHQQENDAERNAEKPKQDRHEITSEFVPLPNSQALPLVPATSGLRRNDGQSCARRPMRVDVAPGLSGGRHRGSDLLHEGSPLNDRSPETAELARAVPGGGACCAHLRQRPARETSRRRTFAIISHPDAGKTTLTEKLLLCGGAIQLAARSRPRATGGARGPTGWPSSARAASRS